MKKSLFVLLICLFAFTDIPLSDASAAEAFDQDSFPYKSIDIEVSPEYDQPPNWPEENAKDHAGVIYWTRAAIVNNTDGDYSGQVTVEVPLESSHYTILGITEFDSEETPVEQGQELEYTVDEATSTISFTPTEPIKKGETYSYAVSSIYAPMEGTDSRAFNFTYELPAKADAVSVNIYFPIGASEQSVTPESDKVEPLEGGEVLYQYAYKDVEKGKRLSYNIAYEKDNYETTVDQKTGVSSESSGDDSNAAWWIVGIILIILIILILYLLVDRSRLKQAPMPRSTKPKLKKSPQTKQRSVADQKEQLKKDYLNGDIDDDTYSDALRTLNKKK